MKAHAPHDYIYGPLTIPGYCWPIIDTPEFQRLRSVSQLGAVNLVYPGANHSRFEHSLGCCHLASLFLDRITRNQPDLSVTDSQRQAVVLAALCHDLGCGPYHEAFKRFAANFDHFDMSARILGHIVSAYSLELPQEVVDAAAAFIRGEPYQGWPAWLAQIVRNRELAVDIDHFDFLCRDMNRTISTSRFEYDRLIVNCRVTDGRLSWKISEVPTLERFFFNLSDMNLRVYKHRVVDSIVCMVADMFSAISKHGSSELEQALKDPAAFCQIDDRFVYRAELGHFGDAAETMMQDVMQRHLYKFVGELRLPRSFKKSHKEIASEVAQRGDIDAQSLRVTVVNVAMESHPMRAVPFWTQATPGVIKLSKEDIAEAETSHFTETTVRLFVTDSTKLDSAKKAFAEWRKELFACD